MKGFALTIFLVGLLSVVSCVTDDLAFPEQLDQESTPSVSLVSLLNEAVHFDTDVELCFDFEYPISLAFNNDIIISITSLEGLIEASVNQTSDLYIEGIVYPFNVIHEQDTASIAEEEEFRQLLRQCEIKSFTEAFFEDYLQCFELLYPVMATSNQEGPNQLNGHDDLDQFIEAQNGDYTLEFEFPVLVKVHARDSIDSLNSYFDFYQILNSCEGCPPASYKYDQLSVSLFAFTYNFDKPEQSSFNWYINDQHVPTFDQTWTGATEEAFLVNFEPGEYDVCLLVETPSCVLGREFCDKLVVRDPCPDLNFTIERQADNTSYVLKADFLLMNSISYTWIITSQENVVTTHTVEAGSPSNTFTYQFDPGLYEICLKAETPNCPEGSTFCKQLEVKE